MFKFQHFFNSLKPHHHINNKLQSIYESTNYEFSKKVSSLDLQKKSTNALKRSKFKQVAQNFIQINQTKSKFIPFKPLKQYSKSMPHKDQIISNTINNISQFSNSNKIDRKSSSLEVRIYTTLNLFSTNQNFMKIFFPKQKCSIPVKDLQNLQEEDQFKNTSIFNQQNHLINQQSTKKKEKTHRFLFKQLQKQQNTAKRKYNSPFKNQKKFKIRKVSYSISPWETHDYC